MPETLTQAAFSEQLNTKFRVHVADSNRVDIELTEVAPGRQTARQEQFSILFRGPGDAFFGQGNYKIEHEKMGAFDLLLVPVAKDDKGFYYEAVFNRLRQ
jgi:L-ascorbate metabolism protein UlaG (beta-lactamase superfamily)